jgi:hypothetical protein
VVVVCRAESITTASIYIDERLDAQFRDKTIGFQAYPALIFDQVLQGLEG